MLILNTGGTFNKRYNEITGELEVPYDNIALQRVLESVTFAYDMAGVVYKDSLEMVSDDRKMIANIIRESKDKKFIVIHGTDTMHMSAEFLAEIFDDREIVFVGAMKPIEIDPIEGSINLGAALGFLSVNSRNGVYISMHGVVTPWNKVEKNREIGKFEIVK